MRQDQFHTTGLCCHILLMTVVDKHNASSTIPRGSKPGRIYDHIFLCLIVLHHMYLWGWPTGFNRPFWVFSTILAYWPPLVPSCQCLPVTKSTQLAWMEIWEYRKGIYFIFCRTQWVENIPFVPILLTNLTWGESPQQLCVLWFIELILFSLHIRDDN